MKTDAGKLEDQQKILLANHGARIEFLEHFRTFRNKGFSSYFAEWGLDLDSAIELPERAWEENVFCTHPWDRNIDKDFSLFASFTRDEMKSAAAWYSIHVKMVEARFLQSDFFAYSTQPAEKGGNRIDRILNGKREEKEVDDCTRAILRHMGGIPRVRGRRAAEDCPTAKFYWCYWFACQIGKELPDVETRNIYKTLYNSSLWRRLVNALEYQVTILSNRRILAAFVAFIMEGQESGRIRKGTQGKEITEAVELVSPLTSSRHLAAVEIKEILALFNKAEPPQ
ncbi:MAG: hypothetical protein ISN29_07880 [Gammaproteobacteria bacterium AqS3]|nr:hypothetical protein [Gammaproteobacteria bacterium AqS3]